MAKQETCPAAWPILRELGPEFLDVAVRAQVAWHGPTAAWAIALDLKVDSSAVIASFRRLVRTGEIRSTRGWMATMEAGPVRGSVDLWAFTLGWLARRSFAGPCAVVTCPAGELELTLGDLIDQEGVRDVRGVRDHLAVLADQLQAAGDPWGMWLAALLSEDPAPRRELESELAAAVKAVKKPARTDLDEFGNVDAALGLAAGSAQAATKALADASGAMGELARAVAASGVLDELRRATARLSRIADEGGGDVSFYGCDKTTQITQ